MLYPPRQDTEYTSQSYVTLTLEETSVFTNQRISKAGKDIEKQTGTRGEMQFLVGIISS